LQVVEILWGGSPDAPLLRLPVLGRTPSIAQVSSPNFQPGPSPVLQKLTFAAPAGLGLNRAVRVLQYLRSTQLRDSDIVATPLQGSEAFVSYADP